MSTWLEALWLISSGPVIIYSNVTEQGGGSTQLVTDLGPPRAQPGIIYRVQYLFLRQSPPITKQKNDI